MKPQDYGKWTKHFINGYVKGWYPGHIEIRDWGSYVHYLNGERQTTYTYNRNTGKIVTHPKVHSIDMGAVR